MEFLVRPEGQPERLGILPGSFNPPTKAHLALAAAALAEMDHVLLVLPRAFPHKNYDGASFGQRSRMLVAAVDRQPRLAAAISEGGLFIEIAQECRAAYGPGVQLAFVCGRDAAERVVGWDYGKTNAINQMLETFQLLVACRQGAYEPPGHLRQYIRALALPADLNAVSASDVRRRIRERAPWQHLVPDAIVPILNEMRGIYRPPA
jgi:nicotinate (nicotinamide) nucleotide adenylyltransferase